MIIFRVEKFFAVVMLIMDGIKKEATENLIKLAKGMEVFDEICEIKYEINEKGEEIAVEKKVRTNKRILPPDLSAILIILEKNVHIEEIDPKTVPREIDYKMLTKAQLKKLAGMS